MADKTSTPRRKVTNEDYRYLLVIISVGILVVAGVFLSGWTDKQFTEPAAVDFSLYTIDGEEVILSQFQGEAVLVNFWGTWCPPCRAEMPLLQRTYEEHRPDLVVVGVNVDDPPERVRRFVAQNQITFPVVLDEDGTVAESFSVRGYPTTFFLDGDSLPQAQHIGLLEEDLMESYLETVGIE